MSAGTIFLTTVATSTESTTTQVEKAVATPNRILAARAIPAPTTFSTPVAVTKFDGLGMTSDSIILRVRPLAVPAT